MADQQQQQQQNKDKNDGNNNSNKTNNHEQQTEPNHIHKNNGDLQRTALTEGSSSLDSASISNISDSITQRKHHHHHQQQQQPHQDHHEHEHHEPPIPSISSTSGGVDGSDFLKHLRAAGAFDSYLSNDDTFGFSRQRNTRHDLNALSELFDESSGAIHVKHMSNEDTVGRSNRSSTVQQKQYNQKLSSLADLFEGPPPPLPSQAAATAAAAATASVVPAPALAPVAEITTKISTNGYHASTASYNNHNANAPQGSAAIHGVAAVAAPKPSLSPPPPQTSPKSVLKKSFHPPVDTTNANNININPNVLSPNSESDSVFRTVAGMPPRPKPLHHHSRSVSWGNNTTFPPSATFPSTDSAVREPTQSEDSFDSVSSLDADHMNHNAGGVGGSSHTSNHHRRLDTRTQFNLDDILGNGPYEAEAETNIIRALEAQQQQRQHLPQNSMASSSLLLGKVPETVAHDFAIDELETEQQGSGSTPNSPTISHGGGKHSVSSVGTGTGAGTGTGTGNGGERVRLLNNNNNNNKKVARHHRRHLSVEQTLVGLTNAMSAMHGLEAGSSKHRKNPEEPYSSASAFANNASRLSEQQEQNDAAVPSRNRAWRIDNLPMVEENRRQDSGGNTTDDNDTSNEDRSPVDVEAGQAQKPSDGGVSDGANGDDDDDPNADNQDGSRITNNSSHKRRKSRVFGEASDKLKAEWEAWGAFFRPRRDYVHTYIKNILLYIILPLSAVAVILFYFGGNPPTGKPPYGNQGTTASASWWLLFTVRQVVTFSMALAIQGLIVDFLSLGTKIMLRLAGPILTLLIVQSKGWPFICFWWSIFDFAMLANGSRFAMHWCYWQHHIGVINEENPSGDVSTAQLHKTVLTVVASVSVVVAVKRFVIGLYLGRQTFSHYGEQLAKVMNSMLLVSEVAELGRDIEKSRFDTDKIIPVASEQFGWNLRGVAFGGDDGTVSTLIRSVDESRKIIDTSCRDPLTGSLPAHEKAKLMSLLGQWEEPTRASDPRQIEIASISAVLRFRKALTFIQKRYPFSYAFGPADTRENCIESSQKVYNRLLMRTPSEDVLQFETLALLALDEDGESIDQQKAKDLVRLFRPDREGNLTLLDFVKSIDSVYKEFRLLDASIQNSSQIDRAFENIFNVVFYVMIFTITLSVLGYNPLALFLSLSSVILAFAFMIGSASSKYFEGVLFILVRRPYNIGDRIHVSGVELDTTIEGTPGWVVEHVTLFETIATWTPTRERCSLSNGSLANSRIINAARSPQAQFHVFLKFPIDTPYDKILIFKTAIEEYMKARPREWLALNGFRAFRIVADQGYVEYVIVIQHRESWQNIGTILDSKANLSSYCNEVARQLNMHYRAPPLPVDLRTMGTLESSEYRRLFMPAPLPSANGGARATTEPPPPPLPPPRPRLSSTDMSDHSELDIDREAHLRKFRQIAMSKHNIRFS